MNVLSPTLYAEKLRHVSPFLYKIAAQSWIDHEYPRHLFIEVTASCNLTCSYCPRERRGEHMDFNLFKGIVDEASTHGSRSFSLHLFGEPLLYPKWREAVRYIKEKNERHRVLLTTNGTRLNALVDEVVKAGFDKVIWTWRPEAQFTPETKEKLRKWGKFMVRLIEEITPPEALKEWGDWKPQERKKLHNYGGQIDLTKFGVQNDGKVVERYECYHLWLAPAIRWNGDMVFCCNVPSDTVYSTLGNVKDKSVAEMWKSEQLKRVREDHSKGVYLDACKNCNSWATYPSMFWKNKSAV